MRTVVCLFLILISCGADRQTFDPESPDAIRLNQIGFYPDARKIAVVISDRPREFFVFTSDGKQKVFTGTLDSARLSPFSDKKTRLANFTSFKQEGSYMLVVPGVGKSFPFSIRSSVHNDMAIGSMKAFYYMRVSEALPEKYAGKWHRGAGHPDTQVQIHPSAATKKRPAGTIISSARGWYDAGDYNKYIVNSGITTGTLLSLCEDFPEYVNQLNLNIPESNDEIPDVLNEILYNLRWMMTMQDPEDGGVYHKLTNAAFDGMVMPGVTKAPRYVVQKGTAATLDFAAVMAQASRVVKKYPTALPGLADSCLTAATRAWQWARTNPNVAYDQNQLNKDFDPDISTGAYGDKNFVDEFVWASAELYCATKDEQYYNAYPLSTDTTMTVPSWANVKLLGYYSLARFEKELTPGVSKDFPMLRKRLITFADNLCSGTETSLYGTVMGKVKSDYIWGSSAVAANQGIMLIQAYRLTGDKKYIDHALGNLDYLAGRNGTGYSFVTGYGSKTPMHPHHRPSEADGIAEPVPGLLSGGPNPGRQDNCTYPSGVADEAYVDSVCSYASNEIAINWNAPLVYLVNAIEAVNNEKVANLSK